MFHKNHLSLASWALLLTLAAAPKTTATSLTNPLILAQAASPTASPDVPQGTQLTLKSSHAMEETSQEYKQRFTGQYPGTDVAIELTDNDAAVKAVMDGQVDMAGIGRALTEQEKAADLVEVPLSRRKIAIIVSRDNPFNKSLTSEQFAKVFRGEIKDWSELGGTAGTVRLIDRPESNGARIAMKDYPVFKEAPFESGSEAVKLSDDSLDVVVQELGKDGISYAMFDQVQGKPEIKVIAMHDTLPDDDRYPFSQPRYFIYKKTTLKPAVIAFLGLTTQTAAQPTPAPEATASPETELAPAPTPAPETAPGESGRGAAWLWWLLLIPLLGGLLWWLLGKKPPSEDEAAASTAAIAPPVAAAAPTPTPESRIVLVPRNCREAYAYWEIPGDRKQDLRRQGGQQLQLRIYDVTDIDIDVQPAHSVQQYDCDELDRDKHVAIPVDDRDYLAEIGYVTASDRWLSLARSQHVRVPACPPETNPSGLGVPEALLAGGAALAGAATAAQSLFSQTPAPEQPESRIVLVPRDCQNAYVYWEIPDAAKAALQQQGGQQLTLRIHEVTDMDMDAESSHSVQEYECNESDRDRHVPIEIDDRDYVAELGYLTADNRWLRLARSLHVRVPACPAPEIAESSDTEDSDLDLDFLDLFDTSETAETSEAPDSSDPFNPLETLRETGQSAIDSATSFATGAFDAAQSLFSDFGTQPQTEERSRILLIPQDSQSADAYWEIHPEDRDALKRQGGETLALRIYDVTDIDIDSEATQNVWQYDCEENQRERHVHLPVANRDYLAELGYLTPEGRWLKLVRSLPTRVPTN